LALDRNSPPLPGSFWLTKYPDFCSNDLALAHHFQVGGSGVLLGWFI
jgi:hypothetical protein